MNWIESFYSFFVRFMFLYGLWIFIHFLNREISIYDEFYKGS